MAGKNEVLDMSDDDFLKMTGPADVPEPDPDPEPEKEDVVEEPVVEDEPKSEPEKTDEPVEEEEEPEDEPEPVKVQKIADGNPLNKADKEKPAPTKDPKDPVVAADKPTPEEPAENTVTTADKEAFYDKVMSGFKANGKKIELRSPDELIQLAQMGCNYTAKMQALAPHRKMLLMLENNGLLDEGKLAYLIDLDKKNPDAIKKLVKEAGIDPLDIDTAAESKYREGNHRVDDKEVAFRSTLDDMRSDPEGLDTLRVLNSTWDQASKDALYENPEIMPIMHQQRQLGVYDRIAAEVNRQKTLGAIPTDKSFVEAYQQVGKQMAAAGAFADIDKAPPAKAAPAKPAVPATPVATRVAAPKAAVTHNDKASAAAATRTTPRQAKVLVNPLEMADDEFLKQMNGRL